MPYKDVEKRREARRRSERKHRASRLVKGAAWRAENAEYRRAWGLKRTYGLSLEDFDALLKAQNNVCAICGEGFSLAPAEVGRRPAVDHSHETGKVRGILHVKCNAALGALGDDPRRLLMAVDYLRCAE